MSLLKTNEIQNYNGSSLTLTASTVSTSAQLNTGGNISVTGSLNVSDDSTTRTNLGLGSIATQDSDNVTVTGGTATLGALTVSGSDSGDLVRITQTGTGNALVVEDSANPDSTPFVVDASGNLLVGTTSTGVASGGSGTSGININAIGAIEVARSANPVMFVNRTTSDGDIMQFRKDGALVGSIGSAGSDLIISGKASSVKSGIRFDNSTLTPAMNGVDVDASVDLGYSARRFKDLYLSGGVVENTTTVSYASSIALTYDNGSIQTVTLTGNVTFTDSLADGESIVLMLNAGASYTVTWPTLTWVTSGGNVAPTLTANDTLVFWKIGSTLYGAYAGSYT